MAIVEARIRELRAKKCVGVLIDLFRGFKVLFVAPIVFEFTFIGRVIAADLRSSLVDAAPKIVPQMFASRVNQQIPVVIVDEHGCPIVQQIPAHEVKIPTIDWFVDGQREIVTALRGAIIAKIRRFWQLAASAFCGRSNGGHERTPKKGREAKRIYSRCGLEGGLASPTLIKPNRYESLWLSRTCLRGVVEEESQPFGSDFTEQRRSQLSPPIWLIIRQIDDDG